MTVRGHIFLLLAVIILNTCFVSSAHAFYQWQDDDQSFTLQGSTRLSGGIQHYPEHNFLYTDQTDESWALVQRLLLAADLSSRLRLNLNLMETVRSVAPISPQLAALSSGVARSGLLSWEQHDSASSSADLTVDAFNLQYLAPRFDFTLGRQAINLATTFYFTPNDFFSPFAAQDFYRVYKPGVDGARTDIRLGELSLLTLIGVLAYTPDLDTGNGWAVEPDWSETSWMARISRGYGSFDLALLGGQVSDCTIAGASLQADLFAWLGVRAEGHYGDPAQDNLASYYQFTVGIEHHFENSFDLRVEYFYNGRGYSDIEQTNQAFMSGVATASGYLGREYAALGLGYELTPLLNVSALAMLNLSDHSQLYSLYALYSISDESELSATVSLPVGAKPSHPVEAEPGLFQINSEFGMSPQSFNLEYRVYF
ncbi:MAG: hypothetical protein KKB30_09345 [Proteobacteria bacterium]|nr:hypothetical protein [Pseudomonadota bacterium]MBU1714127.1 hypothetical protein [Pseudomonadota bacterium]